MKAATCKRYGPPEVLQIEEVHKPVPKAREVLIRVGATAVNSSDWYIRSAMPTAPLFFRVLMRLFIGLRAPRKPILGLVVAGRVEAVGRSVRKFQAADRVFAFTGFHFGAYAEYICLPEATAVATPSRLTDEEAAAIPYGGLLALHFLKKAHIRSGESVIVYGASGAVGTAAVQLATHFGAQVTAVCSGGNAALAKSLGADDVLDYATQHSPPAGKRYDLFFDAVGKRKTSRLRVACLDALAPGGRMISVDDGMPRMNARALAVLKELVDAGKLRPVIDRTYLLEQIADAHRYVEQDHKKGNVVVTVRPV